MQLNFALEEQEVEAGYVLTCQAVPASDHIVLDFDAL
jgi:ring-1,2-phenylacetyl-CoA epoxidase subunit PaaE